MLLKIKRNRLPRDIRASWPAVITAFVAVCIGLVGNILLNPVYVRVFGIYAGIALFIVALMFLRVRILKIGLIIVQAGVRHLAGINEYVSSHLIELIQGMNSQEVVFFAEDDSPAMLNAAALYLKQNEQNRRLRVVHCFNDETEIPPDLAKNMKMLDEMYPDIRIDLLLVKGQFGPDLIERLSRRLNVPKNYMFIGTPSDRFPHSLSELGGVRLIM